VTRASRQQKYCSTRCRQQAHYGKLVAEGRFDPISGQDTALPTNPPKKSNGVNNLQGAKSGSTPDIYGPRDVIDAELFAGRDWTPIVSPDGVTCNPPILKMFEREDWTLFRTVEGLEQKAGVPAKRLRRLVLKELGDNALDTGAEIKFGQIDGSPDKFYIEDNGPGIDGTSEQIAELYSIRRPMRSSKLLRLPQRGALGNGLRVVAGAVLASDGSLVVITRNRRIVLQPRADGHTAVVEVGTARPSRLDLSPASPRNVSTRHAYGRGIRAADLDLQQAGPHREGRL
jgi:hypothetical protein